ncbi:MAG: sodium:solute symporter family protein [Gemmataceae bacterium]|nr:sodium:solute symporter family protein [Gemmataceae bacterium]
MNQVYWGGVAAVAGMYAAFLGVGWLAARKVKEGSAADLILAGRAMPLWIATLTMTATWVDGGYLLGTAEGIFKDSLALGLQGGLCFGISLLLGGLFFAKTMRRLEFTTLIDPFEARFGKQWAAVLFVPALLGEVFWSAELLVALGATFTVILQMDLTVAILLSAVVVTTYTMVGGMWSVAYTDAFQLALIPLGLLAALPFALGQIGGLDAGCQQYFSTRPWAAYLVPPWTTTDPHWTPPRISSWWDYSCMLMLGGIPWNCYFQRVLSCQTPAKARWHSLLAGVLTISLTVPPLLLGMAAAVYAWPAAEAAELKDQPSLTLPLLLRDLTPYAVGILGLAAIIGAVTSSFSASILSAGSMLSWNVYRRLLVPHASVWQMRLVIRSSIVLLGAAATVMALRVQSVQELWFFTSDLIFVLLFPQLVVALFDPQANRLGSITAFAVSLILRLGGGEPLLGLPNFLSYPHLFQAWLPGRPEDWYDPDSGAMLFPFRTLAAAVGMVLLPVVSRLTARWDPPKRLGKTEETLW